MQVDHIVIGQGICGTLLSRELVKRDRTVLVVDPNHPNTSSKIASGLINPVTGKRMVTSWMYEELLPVALDTYRQIELESGRQLLQKIDILDMPVSAENREIFSTATTNDNKFLSRWDEHALRTHFNFYFGVGRIAPCYLVDVNTILSGWRKRLINTGALLEKEFNWKDCGIKDNGVTWKDIQAQSIIDCSGSAAASNPYFALLPFTKNKGEALIASITHLRAGHIYKQGVLKIVPWKDGLFWLGSSFVWDYTDLQPTQVFRSKVEAHLRHWLKLPVEIVDHWAAERPTTVGQTPFVGMHPVYNRAGIFSGMGTKGCSLAPCFAKQLADHLVRNATILPEADVKRFSRILSRSQ